MLEVEFEHVCPLIVVLIEQSFSVLMTLLDDDEHEVSCCGCGC